MSHYAHSDNISNPGEDNMERYVNFTPDPNNNEHSKQHQHQHQLQQQQHTGGSYGRNQLNTISHKQDSYNLYVQTGQTLQLQPQQQQPSYDSPTVPAVPGFKPAYNLARASGKQEISINTQTQEDNVSMFLDELSALNSPSNALSSTQHFQFPPQQLSQPGSSRDNSPIIQVTTPPPPPMIISTPSTEDVSAITEALIDQGSRGGAFQQNLNNGFNPNQQDANSNYLLPDFQNPEFQGLRPSPSNSNLSDLSSAVASPYLSAYSPSYFEDDVLSHFEDDALSQTGFLGDRINANGGLIGINPGDLSDAASEIDLLTSHLNRLTEENLHTNDSLLNMTQSPVTISIEAAPEDASKNTPSLFSSNRSSQNNSPAHSRANSGSSPNIQAGHYSGRLLSPNSPSPDEGDHDHDHDNGNQQHQAMRAGRQRRLSNRSRSSSISHSAVTETDEPSRSRSISRNREKILELASPNQSNKRVQKHPSIYACHLCEKRFTRPYNLKSHLRTHTDERPFVCTVCGKAFARQHDRKRHEDLHSGKKRYECRGQLKDGSFWGCGKKFARTDALGRHFKTEAGKECIRPLIEEHEQEQQLLAQRDGSLVVPSLRMTGALPEELYSKIPGMHATASDAGSDYE